MREERPTILDLVRAVRDFLDRDVRPELKGRLAFHTRVAANALGVVERELEGGREIELAEREGLERLLHRSGTVRELNSELCAGIRAGDLSLNTPGLLEHLRATVDAKLAIDNPKYRPVGSGHRGFPG